MTATPSTEPNEGHGPEVLYEVADHVATITLNRPHRRNAISVRMLELLSELFARADNDDDVRVVILTGAGKGFCSGLDIKDAMAGTGIGGSGGGAGGGSFMQTRNLPTVILQEMDTPVIAVLNGAAAGYGLDLALGADLRLMASSAMLLPGLRQAGRRPRVGRHVVPPAAARLGQGGRDLLPRSRHRRGGGRAHRAREPGRPRRRAAPRWRTSGPPRSPATRRWPSEP